MGFEGRDDRSCLACPLMDGKSFVVAGDVPDCPREGVDIDDVAQYIDIAAGQVQPEGRRAGDMWIEARQCRQQVQPLQSLEIGG